MELWQFLVLNVAELGNLLRHFLCRALLNLDINHRLASFSTQLITDESLFYISRQMQLQVKHKQETELN